MRVIAAFLFGLMIASALAQAQMVFSPGSAQISKTVVGSLPACTSALEGTMFGVTDALTPVALSAAVGGGAVHTLVYCNGSAWIVG